MAHHGAMICIKVAQEAIDLAHNHRGSTWATTGLLSAWWYNILFVYSAATALLAARLHSSLLESGISWESISVSWDRAMDLLEGYKEYSESIPALISTLEMLFEQVTQSRKWNTAEMEPNILGDEIPPADEVGEDLPGIDWEAFLDPANFSWSDAFSLKI
ncbi:hypothetical protein FE257_009082 [Aspergillus nanangensis]|uniref:Uncharacterized protein n=1 Tax=Aspergillus nanangensis TaxID=2582783 RepID=A0AAD4CWP1_ASPNN|nr:hypothetical protein FE257_009082 [Aspergillus nanangensis]